MPNTNPQAILIGNTKIRIAADKLMQAYNYFKILQAEATAEGWLANYFPNNAEVLEDGSTQDGRVPITNQEIRDFTADITSFINFIEANSNTVRNRALKISVNSDKF